jgi:hypothetical protein
MARLKTLPLQLAGCWWLGHGEVFGGAPEVEFFRDGDEAAYLVQCDCHALKVSSDASSVLDRYRSWS